MGDNLQLSIGNHFYRFCNYREYFGLYYTSGFGTDRYYQRNDESLALLAFVIVTDSSGL